MPCEDRKKLSKFMSLVLRHRPAAGGITLDPRGCCRVEDLARAASRALKREVTRDEIEALTLPARSPGEKTRFELEGDFVRAGHGHSLPVEGYREVTPEGPLYHATVRGALAAIEAGGLRCMGRQKVHLSTDREITLEAARRRGRDTVLIAVEVARALELGIRFYDSADPRIILSDDLPPALLRVEEI